MATAVSEHPKKPIDLAQRLRKSPLHGIQPIEGEHLIELSKLDTDPTNPGSHPLSNRYQRREQPIHDSYDILGRIIYPLVVCTIDDGSGHFLLIDGHGRFDEAKKRGEKKIKCIIFPPLTVEQRIILRQVLNAAQEPFDAPLILRDLQTLAKERNLDIRNNDADMDALLADFPESFATEKKKLRVLAAWPEDIADKISIDVNKKGEDGEEQGVIGYAKINQLNVLLNKLKNHHPTIAAHYPGQKLHRQLLKLYFDNVFRDGGRSQEGISNANKAIYHSQTDDPLISDFLKGGMKVGEFVDKAEAKRRLREKSESPLVKLCNELKGILSGVYPPDLGQKEKFALKSTNTVISEVLAEIAAAKD